MIAVSHYEPFMIHAIMTLVINMDFSVIYHRPKSEYAYAYDAKTLHLLLRTKKDDCLRVELIYGDPYQWKINSEGIYTWVHDQITMTKTYQTSDFDYYFVAIQPKNLRTKYTFILHDHTHRVYQFGPHGITSVQKMIQHDLMHFYNFPYILDEDLQHTPSWVEHTIWYQIFPDRFYGKDRKSNLTWGKNPVFNHEHYGGNIQGIIEKLPYLHDLGITGLYFTPMFLSPTAHKYDTTDYFSIDPSFGTNDDFKLMVNRAHELGIKVMLDGVFNHAGFLHPYFQDVIEHGIKSAYADCFYIEKYPIVTFPLSAEGRPIRYQDSPLHYRTFAFQPSMPKWNTSSLLARNHLLNVVKYWIEQYDIDGWRLDVSNEVSHDFLRDIKKTARSVKKDVLILGENWDQSLPWLQGDQLDSVMNYELSYAIWCYLEGTCKPDAFITQWMNHLALTPKHIIKNMFNLVGSHDTKRIKRRLFDDPKRVKCAYVMMFTSPGTPTIYYGDEIGLTGDHDPDNRRCMLWDTASWDYDFYTFTKRLIEIRKNYHDVFIQNPILIHDIPFVIYKTYQKQDILIIVNRHDQTSVSIPSSYQGIYHDLFTHQKLVIHDTIKLEAFDFYLLIKENSDETNHS